MLSHFIFYLSVSNHFTCEGNNLHKIFFAQLSGNGAKDASADGVSFGVNYNRSIAVKFHIAAVRPPDGVSGPDYDAAMDLFVIELTGRQPLFYGDAHDIADRCLRPGVAASGRIFAEHSDTLRNLHSGVVGDVEHCSRLNHFSYPLSILHRFTWQRPF
jgi:hypothetical protein